MKKIIIIFAVLFSLQSQAQSITIPVNRVSSVSASDTSLFSFKPYTLRINVIGGASFGNTNFYYEIQDSIAAYTQHLTPFGKPFSRTSTIMGNFSIPTSFFLSAFDAKNLPIIATFNQILGFMDMSVDTKRTILIQ